MDFIKRQILKHLSKFAKNLKHDKLNLSFLRGEAVLPELQLDEVLITELLELPIWMRVTKVICSHVHVSLPWSKIRNKPIVVTLEEVYVSVETCEDLRLYSSNAYQTNSCQYGFVQKILDGITVNISFCHFTFILPEFRAYFELSRVSLVSTLPNWKRFEHLKNTRVKNSAFTEVLIFKEIVWQTLKFEASSSADDVRLSPLRLIANETRCRIILKKRIKDCLIISSRITLLLDAVIWVLTDMQLKAAFAFVNSFKDLVEKATRILHQEKAMRKLNEVSTLNIPNTFNNSSNNELFSRNDVIETSYHINFRKLQLHFTDECQDTKHTYKELKDGGLLLITLQGILIDYYPYHLAYASRHHWKHYTTAAFPALWSKQKLTCFSNKMLKFFADKNISGNNHLKNESYILSCIAKLMCSVVVFRVENFTLHCVSTNSNHNEKLVPFLQGVDQKHDLSLNLPLFHLELVYFFYPGSIKFSLPLHQLIVDIRPIQMNFDCLTLVWMYSFITFLQRNLVTPPVPLVSVSGDSSASGQCCAHISSLPLYGDCVVSLKSITLLWHTDTVYDLQPRRPDTLRVRFEQVFIANCYSRFDSTTLHSVDELKKSLDHIQGDIFGYPKQPHFMEQEFFNQGCRLVYDLFLKHATTSDNVRDFSTANMFDLTSLLNSLDIPNELFWHENRNVWQIKVSSILPEFGRLAQRDTFCAFTSNLSSIFAWLCFIDGTAVDETDTIGILLGLSDSSSHTIRFCLNHFDFLFMRRRFDQLAEMSAMFALCAPQTCTRICLLSDIVQVIEVALVMPSLRSASSLISESSLVLDSSSVTSRKSTNSFGHQNRLSKSEPPKSPYFGQTDAETIRTRSADVTQSLVANELINDANCQSSFNLKMYKNSKLSVTGGADCRSLSNQLSDNSDTLSNRCSSSDELSLKYDVNSLDAFVCDKEYNHDVNTANTMDALSYFSDQSTVHNDQQLEIILDKQISYSTICLANINFYYLSYGFHSYISLFSNHLQIKECPSISYKEFLTKFSLNAIDSELHGVCNDTNSSCKKVNCDISLLLHSQFDSEQYKKTNELLVREQTVSSIKAKIDDVRISLLMGTLVNLSDFIQDELLPIPVSIEAYLNNIRVYITEDRIGTMNVPFCISIPSMLVTCGVDRVFVLRPLFSPPTSHAHDDHIDHQSSSTPLTSHLPRNTVICCSANYPIQLNTSDSSYVPPDLSKATTFSHNQAFATHNTLSLLSSNIAFCTSGDITTAHSNHSSGDITTTAHSNNSSGDITTTVSSIHMSTHRPVSRQSSVYHTPLSRNRCVYEDQAKVANHVGRDINSNDVTCLKMRCEKAESKVEELTIEKEILLKRLKYLNVEFNKLRSLDRT